MIARARALAADGPRRLLGIAGPPGSGKSTLAGKVVAALQPHACLVPMDGFHLSGAELARLGRSERKGAPDTFDVAGYVALLRRLREARDETVLAPAFRREIEEPIPDAIAVAPGVRLVVTEGNYLLCEDEPWSEVRPLLDECWYVVGDDRTRIERLEARHVAFGRSPEAARVWARGTDERNAEVVAATRHRADLEVHQ